jgi:uncharacterized protein YecT (DUF1311 family)
MRKERVLGRIGEAIFGSLLLSAAPSVCMAASPDAVDCSKAVTQMDMNQCADRDFRAWDAKLNALYRVVMKNQDTKGQMLLRTAERNWIAWRDSECAFESASSEGGSIQPMEYSLCLTDKTHARIKELELQRDCPEGDLRCNRGR